MASQYQGKGYGRKALEVPNQRIQMDRSLQIILSPDYVVGNEKNEVPAD